MGRTSKPLRILIDPVLWDKPEIQELRDKGHDIEDIQETTPPWDLILSPNAWRMFDTTLKYLPLAIKAARQQKYPAKKKGGQDAD